MSRFVHFISGYSVNPIYGYLQLWGTGLGKLGDTFRFYVLAILRFKKEVKKKKLGSKRPRVPVVYQNYFKGKTIRLTEFSFVYPVKNNQSNLSPGKGKPFNLNTSPI